MTHHLWTRRLLWVALPLFLLAMAALAWQGLSFTRWALASQQAGLLVEQGLAWPEPRYSDSLPAARDASALERALPRLEAAHRLRPQEAWPLWQMARIYVAQGGWLRADAAYAEALARDPGNPLVAWEAGLLSFERLDQTVTVDPIPITDQIAAGALAAPERIVGTPYCSQGSCYMGLSSVTQPMATDRGGEPVSAPFLFLHPPAEITSVVDVPASETLLTVLLGLDPYAAEFGTDGAEFTVTVLPISGGEEEGFTWALDEETLLAGWTPASVDLSPWSGQRISLTFRSGPGTSGEAGGDWIGWGAIALAPPSAAVTEEELKQNLRAAWTQAGITDMTLLVRAERSRIAEEYERAERWFRTAIAFADVGESGLLHVRWARAAAEEEEPDHTPLREAVRQDAGWGSALQRGTAWTMWGRALQTDQDFTGARDAYQVALDVYMDMEGRDADQAAASQRLGDMQLALGEYEAAAVNFERVITLQPDNIWGHLGYGRALLAQEPPAIEEAVLAFDTVLEAAPDNEAVLRAVLQALQGVGARAEIAEICAGVDPALRTELVETICTDPD